MTQTVEITLATVLAVIGLFAYTSIAVFDHQKIVDLGTFNKA